MHTQRHRTSAGFTLIELLVVIAIIAILAAILFPVFATARAKARQINGLSDTKQMGLAILMYNQDFDGDYPLSGWSQVKNADGSTNIGPETNQWSNRVGPYVKSGGVVTDPADTSVWAGNANPANGEHSLIINDLLSHNPLSSGNAFGDNDWNGGNGLSEEQQVAKNESSVNSTSDCVLVMEGHCNWGGTSGLASYDGYVAPAGQPNKFLGENNISQYATINVTGTNYSGWHVFDNLPMHQSRTGTNVDFCDGHAKYFNVTDGKGNNTIAGTLPFRKNIDPTQNGMGKGDWINRGLGGGTQIDNWE